MIGVVNNRRKKVQRLHQRDVRRDKIHACIIAGCETYKKICVHGKREVTQYLRELGGPNLRRSTGAAYKMRQPGTLIDKFAQQGHLLPEVHTITGAIFQPVALRNVK